MASKVVVVGDVNGQLKTLFTKLATLQAKQNFSFAVVAGNLFADEEEVADLLAEKIAVPLTTYFTVGTRALPQSVLDRLSKDEDVCPNLYFLGKRSTTKTSDGVKIVTLGGQLDEAIVGLSKEQTLPFHTTGDANSLRGANTADILITTLWPAGVRKGSAKVIAETATEPKSHEHIAELCSVLKPRYHFSASDFFFEREPFFHQPSQDSPDVRPITRFISIARFGNTDKEKAMYAFSLPQSPDLTAPIPQGTTASPFISTRKRPALESEPYSRFAGNQHNAHRDKRRKVGDRYRPPPGPEDCFFCLSNPNIGQHLISSIGEDSYLTMAKGPLTTPTTYSSLGINNQAHALIIPFTHLPTIAAMAPDEREKTLAEMTKFRESLQTMVGKQSSNKLGAVTYEISQGDGVHTHWQFIPMSGNDIRKGLVEMAFKVEAENRQYPEFEARDPGIGQGEGDFFRVWLWTPPSDEQPEGSTKCLTMPIDSKRRFYLQFGRVVLAKLLGLENRLQWRDCAQSDEEEKKEAEGFKAAFKEFDFTI